MAVGRHGECAAIRAAIADSRGGRGRLFAVRGDPGIGKTWLLNYAVDSAEGFRVIRMQGHETERDIPYAGLSMLVGPLLADATELPKVQRAALEGALNLGPAAHGDRVGIMAATMTLLAGAAERQPLVVAVDDVHLIDQQTVDVLVFALRRMYNESLVAIITARTENDVPASTERWLESLEQIHLGGLDLISARELTADRGRLSREVWEAAAGNPLALLELMIGSGSRPFVDGPIELPARLIRAYGRRLVGLSEKTRLALLLVAVAGRATDVLDDALAHRDLSRADLEPAEDAGLVVVEDSVVRFTHPLVCSTVYYSASAAERRSAHQTMVEAYAGRKAPGATERQAFHLAAATPGPDESVASKIDTAARAASARFSHATAAALFEKAAMLSPVGASRTQRTIDAAVAGQAAGTFAASGPLLDRAIAETDDEHMRIAAMHLQCRIQMWSGHPAQARDQLLDLAERTEEAFPGWSAMMWSQAAVVSIALGEQRRATGMATRAMKVAAPLSDSEALPVLVSQAVTQAINGEAKEAAALLQRCAPLLERCDPLSIDQVLVLAALAYASLGELATARLWLERAVHQTSSVYAFGLLPFQLSWLTLICWLDGDWVAALDHGHKAVAAAEETGWATELPNCLVALATVEAGLGNAEAARTLLVRAARIGAQQSEARVFSAHAARVTGLIELGAARAPEAVAAMRQAAEFAGAARIGSPVLFNWAGDLTEALSRSGRAEQAAQTYEAVVREAEQTRRPAALAVAARCRGLLARSGDDIPAAFAEALTWHEVAGQPFEEAHTRLCYGEYLRRRQLRGQARMHLEAALATFDRLGAIPWAARAEVELRATGQRAGGRKPSPTKKLTSQEVQVARAVAQGMTNAEVAGNLFLTPKTIESHLTNIYRKLDIRSRVELTRKVLDGLFDQSP